MSKSTYAHALKQALLVVAGAKMETASSWIGTGLKSLSGLVSNRRWAGICAAVVMAIAATSFPEEAEAQDIESNVMVGICTQKNTNGTLCERVDTNLMTGRTLEVLEGETVEFVVRLYDVSPEVPTAPDFGRPALPISYSVSITDPAGLVMSSCSASCSVSFPAVNQNNPQQSGTGDVIVSFPTRRDAVSGDGATIAVTVEANSSRNNNLDTNRETATVTVLNVPTATVRLEPANVPVREGGTFSFWVEMSGGTVKRATDLTWNLSTTASCTLGDTLATAADFESFPSVRTISLAKDVTRSTTIMLETADDEAGDEAGEAPECVAIEVTNPDDSGVVLAGLDAMGIVYAVVQETPIVTVTSGTGTVEGQGDAIAFTFTRTGVTTGTLTIAYTVSQTAGNMLPPNTVLPIMSTATFAVGASETTVSVQIHNDEVDEVDATLRVDLDEPAGNAGYVLGMSDKQTWTVTVLDDDTPALRVSSASASEGDSLAFEWSLTPASYQDITVSYKLVAVTATENDDYRDSGGGSFMIAAGDTSGTVAVEAVDDDLDETSETFQLQITSLTVNGITRGNWVVTGTITDTDSPVLSISNAQQPANEGEDLTFAVAVSPANVADIIVTYTLSGTGISEDDFTLQSLPATLTLTILASTDSANSVNSASIVLTTVADGEDEPNEVVTVRLLRVEVGDASILQASAIGTITDGDVPTVSIQVGEAEEVSEGSRITFVVSLNSVSFQAIPVSYALQFGSEASNDDFESPPPRGAMPTLGTVTVPAGGRSVDIVLATVRDSLNEVRESAIIGINTTNVNVVTVDTSSGTATGYILDIRESVLIVPRRQGAKVELRHHVDRFWALTTTATSTRISGEWPQDVQASGTDGLDQLSSFMRLGEETASHDWAVWSAIMYGRIDGYATGHTFNGYLGVDSLSVTGQSVWGWLIGHEDADLKVGDAEYFGGHFQAGVYGASRFGDGWIFDGAVTWGSGKPRVSQDDVHADFSSQRLSLRASISSKQFDAGRWLGKVEPWVGALYARQQLDEFEDSVGAKGLAERLSMNRLQAGARMLWDFETVQFAGFPTFNYDREDLEFPDQSDMSFGIGSRATWPLNNFSTVDVRGEVDGLGSGNYRSYSLGFSFRVKF